MTWEDFRIILAIGVIVLLLALFSMLSISSDCSRREEKENFELFGEDKTKEEE